MGRRKSRLLTLIKLSPLYLVAAALLYVLLVVDKDFDYLASGRECFETRDYERAMDYLDMAVDRNLYRGSALLEVLLLRAQTLAQLRGFSHALEDLDKIIQLRPESGVAREARSLKGDILANQLKYKESLAVFEKLIEETKEDEDEYYEYQSKAAAAAYNISSVMLEDAEEILNRNLQDPSRENDGLERYVTNLDQDYPRSWLRSLLTESLASSISEQLTDLASEANRYYRYAYAILEEYPYKSAFNPMSSDFLANIFYRSKRYLAAVTECALVLKEPLDLDRRLNFQQILANVYWDLGRFGEAAGVFESIRGPWNRPHPGLDPTVRQSLTRNILLTRLKNGDYDRVISEGRALLSKGDPDLVVKYCTGAAYVMKKKPFDAFPLLSEVVEVIRRGEAPDYLDQSPARKECFQLLIQSHLLTRSFQSARAVLDFSVQLYPDDLEFRRRRAALLDEQLGQPSLAAQDYLYLLRHGPRDAENFADWLRTKEVSYSSRTQYLYADKARQLLDRFERHERQVGSDIKKFSELTMAASFPEARGEPGLMLALCETFMERGRREQGKSILRMLSRSMPDILELPFRLGRIYYQEGEFRPALREFESVLERDPGDFESAKLALACFRNLKDIIGEGRLIQKILKQEDEGLRRWMLARLACERENHEDFFKMYDAMAVLPEALQMDLDLMAARCRIAENRMGLAARLIDPILECEPDRVEALILKAELLLARAAGEAESRETPPLEGEGGEAPSAEPPAELEQLVDHVHALGPSLAESDLNAMCALLNDRGRPDLLLRLVEDLETVFPYSMEITRNIARAHQETGEPGRAAACLLNREAALEDLRWSMGLTLTPGAFEDTRREIVLKTRGREEEGEFLLRAAGGAVLAASTAEAKRFLGLSSLIDGKGPFCEEEAEYIDFLTRLLLLYDEKGLDIRPGSPPEEQEESNGEQEEPPPAEPGDAESLSGTRDQEAQGEAGGGEEKGGSGSAEEKADAMAETGAEEGEDDPSSGAAEQETGREEEDVEAAGQQPPLTGDDIVLGGMSLSERYDRIVPGAVYFMNKWRQDPSEGIPWARTLLRHLLLRHVPGFEKECLESALEVLDIDPACGIAARFDLDQDPRDPDARRTVMRLTPVITAVPDDLETLKSIGPALAAQGIKTMTDACLTRVGELAGHPFEAKQFEAEILLARGDREQALARCLELLEEEGADPARLKGLIPLMIPLKSVEAVARLLDRLEAQGGIDDEAAEGLIPYLREAPDAPESRAMAEKLMGYVSPRLQPGLIEVLARSFHKERNETRLDELADRLVEIRFEETMDWDALYRTFRVLAVGMAAAGDQERAIELLEYQYYLRPDRGEPLGTLAGLAASLGRVRQSTEYLELYNLLHPWDAESGLQLARNWFFKLGEFEKAYNLFTRRASFYKEDPSLSAQITLGYFFIQGDLTRALREIERQRFREGVKTPETLFLTATIYYLGDDLDSALRLYTMLNEEFERNPYFGKTTHLIERIQEQIDQRNRERKDRGGKAPRNKRVADEASGK